MTTAALEIYEMLKRHYSEPEAQKFVSYIEDARDKEITSAVERKIEHLATKEDLAKQIGDLKADTIKWMFLFILGQTAVLAALTAGIVKLMMH